MARRRSRRRLSPAEKKALASLRDFVREQGLNDTAPRRAVLIAALRMRSRFSAEDLVAIHNKVRAIGSVFMLNVGPRPFGDIHPEEQRVLRDIGQMIRNNEQS